MKQLLLLLVLLPLQTSLCSPSLIWECALVGNWAQAVEQTDDGGFIVVGDGSRHGEETLPPGLGATHWLVAKLSAEGEVQWKQRFGGPMNASPYSVSQLADGGYLVAGYNSCVDSLTRQYRHVDAMIVRLRPDGTTIWIKTFGGIGNDVLYSIKVTTDGGCVAAGTSNSADSLITNPKERRATDYWIVKLSAEGNIQWQTTVGGSSHESSNSVRQTRDGGYIVVGEGAGVVRLSPDGKILWQRDHHRDWSDTFNEVQLTADGGYIVAGYTESDKTPGFGGWRDLWIVKLTDMGWIQWELVMGGSGVEGAGSIDPTNDGGFVTAGYGPNFSLWVMKLTANGAMVWKKQFQDFGQGRITVRNTRDGCVVLAGERGSITEEDHRHFWIAKLSTEIRP